MNLGESIRRGAKWLVAGSAGNQVLQFIVGIILARLLVPADFGMIVTIQAFTGVASLLTGGGMGQALVRAKDASERDFHVVFTMQLTVGSALYALFYVIAPYFAVWFGDELYRDLLRTSALYFLLRPLITIHNSWLHREMRFRERTIVAIVSTSFAGLTSVILAWTGFGVWSLVFGGLTGAFLNLILLRRLTPLRPLFRFDTATARRVGGYGAKVSANDLVSYLRAQSSNVIISRLTGAHAVGLFNKADSLGKMPFSTVSSAVYQPVFRAMASEQDNPDKIKYLFFRTVMLLTVYTLPLYVGLWWCAEPFIVFVYGEKWAAAGPPLEILAVAGLLYCVGHPCGAVLAACNRLGRELVVQLITLGLVIAGCLIGLRWGLEGVAWAIVVSQLYATTHMYFLATRCFRSRLSELGVALAPGLALNALLVATVLGSHFLLPDGMAQAQPGWYLLIVGGTGAVVYAAAFLFLPLPALAAETARWRKLLRLAK